MQLAFTMLNENLIYALKVHDDGTDGGIIWSVVEHQEELDGILGLTRGVDFMSFLFNELAINVSWNYLRVTGSLDRLPVWVGKAALGRVDHSAIKATAFPLFDRLHHHVEGDDEWLVLEVEGKDDWKRIYNHLMTANGSFSLIDMFDCNEGNQQEQLVVWLTDSLQPSGAHHSPQVSKNNKKRELTDILLNYEFGAILIESKTLSILSREKLPERAKLKRDTSAHIRKAFTQLRGAIRALKSGATVTSSSANELVIEREYPAHAVVLIPDLELVEDHAAYGIEFIQDFMSSTGGFAHLLDVSELLRIVQAAETIAAQSTKTTPMMALDYYLMERAKTAINAGTLCIEVLLNLIDDDKTSPD